MQNSSIEWTNATWNPTRGCDKISPGCTRCYAETFAERFRGVAGHPYEQGFDIRMVPERLEDPIHWKKGRRIFVNSMSDLFHEAVPASYIEQVFKVMEKAQQHTYQILTKRHDRMRELMNGQLKKYGVWPHIWLGVSVENQKYAQTRIKALVDTPAAVRFLSCEPLLGPLDFRKVFGPDEYFFFNRINLVIVGGESGHGCRPMETGWARSILAQCREMGTKFFCKQLGGFPDKRHLLTDFPEDLRVRDLPDGASFGT